jgi:hypothetical protein
VILPRLVGFVFGIGLVWVWFESVISFYCALARLLGNHCSQDCKAITSLVCSQVVRQSFGSSGLLDPIAFNKLILRLDL